MPYYLITIVVFIVLSGTFRFLTHFYGNRVVAQILTTGVIFFYCKEFFQHKGYLIDHYYELNPAVWIRVGGVSVFVLAGHLFVILVTWQLAVNYLKSLKWADDRYLLIPVIFFMTASISYPMEVTGWIGRWWTWDLPTWFSVDLWTFRLRDMPWHRVVTTAWGFFISVFWAIHLYWDPALCRYKYGLRYLFMAIAATLLLLASHFNFMVDGWIYLILLLPFWVSLLQSRLPFLGGRLHSRATKLIRAPTPKWFNELALGIYCMVATCTIEMMLTREWIAAVSFIPLLVFFLGMFRLWPLWVDGLFAVAMMFAGIVLVQGNVLLAGFLILRLVVFLYAYQGFRVAVRWCSLHWAPVRMRAPAAEMSGQR